MPNEDEGISNFFLALMSYILQREILRTQY